MNGRPRRSRCSSRRRRWRRRNSRRFRSCLEFAFRKTCEPGGGSTRLPTRMPPPKTGLSRKPGDCRIVGQIAAWRPIDPIASCRQVICAIKFGAHRQWSQGCRRPKNARDSGGRPRSCETGFLPIGEIQMFGSQGRSGSASKGRAQRRRLNIQLIRRAAPERAGCGKLPIGRSVYRKNTWKIGRAARIEYLALPMRRGFYDLGCAFL